MDKIWTLCSRANFSYMIALMTTASMFAWLIIPVMYMGGNAPVNDDVTKFLYNFSHDFHPLIVSAVAAMIIGIGVVLMIKKELSIILLQK